MNLKGLIESAREIDKNWQRTRRPDKRKILVNARTAMNFATIEPIVQRLQADERIELYFTASESPNDSKRVYSEANGPVSLISPSMAAFLRFDVYLAADFLWVKLPRGTKRVQTFHGVAGKYRTIYDSPAQSMREWDRLFFINRHRLQHFIDSGAIDADSPAACLIGMPKLDCLVDGSLDRDRILISLGIDPSSRTVLYAPTWSPYSSLSMMGEELVKSLGRAGYVVIVKLHDRSRDLQYVNSGGIDWGKRLEPQLREYKGVLVVGSNSSKYLPAAELLITDHSSVGFEYLLLDRPVVRIHIPELIAKTDIEPAYVELLSSASVSVSSAEEAVSAVNQCFRDSGHLSDTRKSVAQQMFYDPGRATARAVSKLYELVDVAPPQPLNHNHLY